MSTLHPIETADDLPSLNVLTELVDIYFATIHISFPFLNPARFRSHLRHGSYASRPSLALIYAILAISTPYSSNPSVRNTASYYYTRARTKMDEDLATNSKAGQAGLRRSIVHAVTLDTVQCGLLLTVMEFGDADHQTAFMTAVGHVSKMT